MPAEGGPASQPDRKQLSLPFPSLSFHKHQLPQDRMRPLGQGQELKKPPGGQGGQTEDWVLLDHADFGGQAEGPEAVVDQVHDLTSLGLTCLPSTP